MRIKNLKKKLNTRMKRAKTGQTSTGLKCSRVIRYSVVQVVKNMSWMKAIKEMKSKEGLK